MRNILTRKLVLELARANAKVPTGKSPSLAEPTTPYRCRSDVAGVNGEVAVSNELPPPSTGEKERGEPTTAAEPFGL